MTRQVGLAIRGVLAGAAIALAAADTAPAQTRTHPPAHPPARTHAPAPPPAEIPARPPATGFIDWAIWVDPDGCMHWYADGGLEGYMVDRVNPRTGRPVCLKLELCAVENTDVLFDTDSARLTRHGRARLESFFRNAGAFGYAIYGHTDSRGSDEHNMRLSQRRAAAVATVARSVGAAVDREIGFGERQPVATNATAAGMQRNRRVEIVCYRW